MRVIGVSFIGGGRSEVRPLDSGYLPVSTFSGILGRNDSGKSRLLELVGSLLDPAGDFSDIAFGVRGTVYAECERSELGDITAHAISDLVEHAEDPTTLELKDVPAKRGSWWIGGTVDAEFLEGQKIELSEDPVGDWRGRLLDCGTGDPEAWRIALDAASGGSDVDPDARYLIAIEPQFSEAEGRTWNIFWCLPPVNQVSEDLKEALHRLGYGGKDWAAWQAGILGLRKRIPIPASRQVEGAPVILAPIGRARVNLLPIPLFPRNTTQTVREIETAIGRFLLESDWCSSLFLFASDGWIDDGYYVDIKGDRPEEAWVLGGADGWEVHPDASVICTRIEQLAQTALPSEVSSSYRIVINVLRPDRWVDSRIDVRLAPVDPKLFSDDPDDPVENIPLDDVAEGLKLWIQVALLEAASEIDGVTNILRNNSSMLSEEVRHSIDVEDPDNDNEMKNWVEACRSIIKEVRDVSTDLVVERDPVLTGLPRGRMTKDAESIVDLTRGRVYLIDEPERYLHPGLQRRMAKWLERNLIGRNAQAITVTHAVPFMGYTRNSAYSYLLREGTSPTVILPIEPREMSEMGLAAEELGLDRGELLALTQVILWVEGEMDRIVLETLFPTELKERGILVVPMGGHLKATSVLDSSLLRFTKATPAVWLDKIPRQYAAKLTANRSFAESAFDQEKDEKKSLASVALASHDLGRDVVLVAPNNPGDDVFDLLDDKTIMDIYPGYPGHKVAQETWDELVAQGKKVSERKQFWEKRFKTPISEESCRLIAERMRQTGASSQELREVLDSLSE